MSKNVSQTIYFILFVGLIASMFVTTGCGRSTYGEVEVAASDNGQGAVDASGTSNGTVSGTEEGSSGGMSGGGQGQGDPDITVPGDDVGSPTDPSTSNGGTSGGTSNTTPTDTGSPTDPGTSPINCEARCLDTDLLEVCEDSGERVEVSCQNQEAYCDSEALACTPWVCAPGQPFCLSESQRAVCNAQGSNFIVDLEGCENSCDEATGDCIDVPEDFCGLQEITPLTSGEEFLFNLCDESDDDYNIEGGSCSANGIEYGGADRLFSITLTERSLVSIDLRDEDSEAAIDTVVYIRTDCRDVESQVGCGDDISCGDADVTSGCRNEEDVQVRQSRLSVELDPGVYYIVADQYNYQRGTNFTCGQVLLTVDF